MDYETYLFQPEFAGRYLRPTGEGGYVGGPRGVLPGDCGGGTEDAAEASGKGVCFYASGGL